jgi:hypothetical protein
VDAALHEALLGSPYRTHDPERADFFFVPVYLACYLHPVWRFSSYPDYAPGCDSRTVSGMRLLRAASAFIAQVRAQTRRLSSSCPPSASTRCTRAASH